MSDDSFVNNENFSNPFIQQFMTAILSPAKTPDFETEYLFSDFTIQIEDSKELIDQLKNYSVDELSN